MTLYDRIAEFPLKIESYNLETVDREQLGGRTRTTTLVSLQGDGVVGRGEDVIYDEADHHALVDGVLAGEREQGPIGLGFRIDERTVVCLIVDDVLATTNDAISL